MWQRLYRWLLKPNALDEDTQRKELILNVLLLSMSSFIAFLTIFTLLLKLSRGAEYTGIEPIILLVITMFFTSLLIASRKRLYQLVAYVFVGIFFVLLTWPTIVWGVGLPQVILTYSLLVVMTGVLISSRMAFYMAGLISLTLLFIFYLSQSGVIVFNQDWLKKPAGYADIIVYCLMFLIIALVSWLSNREIDHSLRRARQSEQELLEERNSLERKVKARTKALEKAHVEKMLDLQRFAEFGRLSSTLLHELANPLTSVSLDLQQLEDQNRSKLIGRVREGITHLEQYVETARRQLRNESEVKTFDVALEIERITGFLGAKARAQRVEIEHKLVRDVSLKGDTIRFDHIISNLLSNAIDAYDDMETSIDKKVILSTAHKGAVVEIVVQDFGRGITKAQMSRLFEPFYTTKEMARGTGIGLTITKQAVEEAFQGTITVSHDKNNGTRFTVRLPLT